MANDIFKTLDLNLLRIFIVLSQEKNMRKASQKMYVSQPAISQSLQKLRAKLGDELFIKVSSGLEPTAFAEELYEQILPHFDALHTILDNSQDFIPEKLDSTLRIALSPVVLSTLCGSLFYKIRELAPLANIELVSWTSATLDEIQKGDTLIAINHDIQMQSKEIYSKNLVTLTGRVIVRKNHPIKKPICQINEFENVEIASVINPGWNDNRVVAGEILDSHGIQYKVGFRSELVMAIIDVLRHTDMYMPDSNIFPVNLYPDLRAIDIRIDDEPYHYPIQSYYHTKNRNSPVINWLNDLITTVLEDQIAANK
ncbi:MAG: LysR family transcriptional regulator [Psychromonas sp.]